MPTRTAYPMPQPLSPESTSPYNSPSSSMDPINVLSDPHKSNPNPAPASIDAAAKLQLLLVKTAAAVDGAVSVVDQPPELADEVRSVHSTTSLRFAKGIVGGIFGRGKKCAIDDAPRSPTNSVASPMVGGAAPETGNGAAVRKRTISPSLLFQEPLVSPPMGKTKSKDTIDNMSDVSDDDVVGEFSVLRLVDNARNKSNLLNPGALGSSVITPMTTHPENINQPSPIAEPPLAGQDTTPVPAPIASLSTPAIGESSSSTLPSFQIPARGIIRQSSASSSITKTPTTSLSRQPSRKSGVAALTNVLSTSNYRRKITSLTPPGEYVLPDNGGYVSFPPFVPSNGLGALFGNSEDGWGGMKRFPSFRKKRADGGENAET